MLIYSGLYEKPENKVCLIYNNMRLTYGKFTQHVDDLAHRLAMHIKKGDKVLLKLADPLSQLCYFLGIVKAGGACIFIDPATSEEVCASLMSNHQLALSIDGSFQLSAASAPFLPEIHPEDLFLGALSSGSTGTPKLIWRDHQSWTRAFPSQSMVFQLSSADTLYVVSSLVYTANLNACLHILFEGGTVMFASAHMPRTWVREIESCGISAIFMVPANYKILLKHMKVPLPKLHSLVTCGAKMDLLTLKSLLSFFPSANIFEYYGASELGHVSYCTANDLLERPDSVGQAFPHVIISIVDDIIWIESPYIAPAYRPKASVEDLGRLDEKGYLYLLGRKNGIINTGGIKVIPEQVEAVLLQCPGIAQAVVGGIEDLIRGQKVCAWIVKNQPALTSGDVLDFCHKKMRPHYCPQKIIFLDEIPLNSNGKIDRINVKNQNSCIS